MAALERRMSIPAQLARLRAWIENPRLHLEDMTAGQRYTLTAAATGLTAGTTYNYAALSANAAGGSSASANFLFTTSASGAPVISSIAVWPVSCPG